MQPTELLTKNQIQKEKEFLIKRIKLSTSTESIVNNIISCHNTWKRYQILSPTTTSITRLENLVQYETLLNILEDKTMIENRIEKLQSDLDHLKKIVNS
jgi:hypothetical protein